MKIYTKKDIEKIIKSLNNDEIFAIKTDTVYGIMAKASSNNEKRINSLKKSDTSKKLSIIYPDVLTVIQNSILTEEQKQIIEDKLPGPYTFIIILKNHFDFIRNDFGIRVTTYDFLQKIIKETGPLLATSCNISGYPVCQSFEEIKETFKDTNLNVVEDTITSFLPSTIIDLNNNAVLR